MKRSPVKKPSRKVALSRENTSTQNWSNHLRGGRVPPVSPTSQFHTKLKHASHAPNDQSKRNIKVVNFGNQ